MIYRASDMVKDVRIAIDMNRRDDPLFAEEDIDTLSLDDIIREKLADAVRMVEMEAPLELLESGHDLRPEGSVFIDEDGKGFIPLPSDFMRLVAFRMSDWKRTVFEAISESDPQYALQSSRFKGICGNPDKPVVAIVRRAEGKVLEFYSCKSADAGVAQATYLPLPKIDSYGGIDVAEECYRAAVYRAASLALASVGDQLSATMLEISRGLIIQNA